MRPTLDAQGRPVLGPDGTAAERLPPLTPHQACPQGHAAAVRRPAGGLTAAEPLRRWRAWGWYPVVQGGRAQSVEKAV